MPAHRVSRPAPGWRSAGRNAKLQRPAIITLETPMIDLYAMGSPNVVKIYIALEEMGLPYAVHPVDVFGELAGVSPAQPERQGAGDCRPRGRGRAALHGFRVRGHPGLLGRQNR